MTLACRLPIDYVQVSNILRPVVSNLAVTVRFRTLCPWAQY